MKVLPRLRDALVRPTAMLALALVSAATMLAVAIGHRSAAEHEWLASQNRQTAARRQLDEAHREKAAIEESIRTLQHWKKRGLIGGEDRLAWVETIQNTARAVSIRDIRFKFEARKPVGKTLPQGMHWHAISMNLSMNGIDELRLLRFLEKIIAQVSAEIVVRQCELKLAAAASGEPPSLTGECVLDWLTIEHVSGGA